ncbi:uncharacterized protein [Haliotis asinina]|uniref:uncharacterized protein n=1 Tax=Haliotis asinina TaxID=109174 RepID=UPI0035319FCB
MTVTGVPTKVSVFKRTQERCSRSSAFSAYFHSSLYRSRAKEMPTLLRRRNDIDLPDHFAKTATNADFLLHATDHNKIMIFATDENLRHLAAADKAAEHSINLRPSTFFSDFEKGAQNAAKEVIQCELKGCMFHYRQALVKHARNCGLQGAYKNDDNGVQRFADYVTEPVFE